MVVAPAIAVELPQVQVAGAVVVVHDVEVHGEAALVASLDEFLQRIGSAVGVFHRELVARIVAPAVITGEFVDRQEQDAVHTHVDEVVELGRGVAQRAGSSVLRIGIVESPGM